MSRFSVLLAPFLFLANAIHPQVPAPTPIEQRTNRIATVSLEDLAASYDGILLDAYGVFWGSKEVGVLPGAAEAMRYLVAAGKTVGILSNSTMLASKEKAKLEKHGLIEGVHYHFLLTSGEVAKTLLQAETLPFSTPRKTYCLFGAVHPNFGSHHPLFEGTEFREVQSPEEADFLYVSIPHIDGRDQENPEVFRQAVNAAAGKLPVLCVNPDRFALEGSPARPVVRQGSIAQLFVEAGASVYLMGKPSKIIYEAALRQFPAHVSKIVMIGDTPETDIRGAHGAGLDAALVTKTGIMAKEIENRGVVSVVDGLAASDQPDFLLDRLGL